MKYIENGYYEIKKGIFVKTYVPYEDGTPATEKQKTAIKNMRSYLAGGPKTSHELLTKRELSRIEKLTKVQAMKEIGELIEDIKNREDYLQDAWCDPPF